MGISWAGGVSTKAVCRDGVHVSLHFDEAGCAGEIVAQLNEQADCYMMAEDDSFQGVCGDGGDDSTPCIDDPQGILAADGTTCADKMAQVNANCETVDQDYNGYRATYSQLCPATCN